MRRSLTIPILFAVIAVALVPSHAAAAGSGTIKGIVTNAATDKPQPGVEVTLTTGTETGADESGTQVVTTDQKGAYIFRDLATGEDRFYAIDGRFEEGLFSGGAITVASPGDVIDSTLKVWPTTSDPSMILISRDNLFLSVEGNELGVLESVTLLNQGEEAYIGRVGATTGTSADDGASIAFPLPSRAIEGQVAVANADINLPALIPSEFGFAITAAIPPGETTITYSYKVEGDGGSYDLSRKALYPTVRFSVFSTPPLDVKSNRLSATGPVPIGDKVYEEFRAGAGLDGGDSLQILAIADAGTPAGLIVGMAGALVLVAALGALPLIRSRRKSTDRREPTREDLLRAIASLDLQRENGEIAEDEWTRRRGELKQRLAPAPGQGSTG
ncbi:MAG: hypothetical protein H0U53_10585 [Actinobacteria bacterium]|nr:hypothetical protein [Actinomycetota bacterium]